jgi:hypothetical protein
MTAATTIRDLLFEAPDQSSATTRTEQLSTALRTVTATLSPMIPVNEVIDAVWDLLGMPLADVMHGAWDRFELVTKAKANTAGDPGAIEKVKLASHTIRSEHHPRVEVEVAGASIPALRFDLVLAVTLDGAVITIAGGEIKGIATGEGRAEATLSAGGTQLAHRTLATLVLPGARSLAPV